METLGLHVSTKQHQSPTRRSGEATPRAAGLLSPGRPRELEQQQQLNWDENLLLWPIEQLDEDGQMAQQQQQQQPSATKSRPSLISFKHQCHHDLLNQQEQAVGGGGGPSLLDLALGVGSTQTEFMRQFELMNVSNLGVEVESVQGAEVEDEEEHQLDEEVPAPAEEVTVENDISEEVEESPSKTGGQRFKLWHPERDTNTLETDEDLIKSVLSNHESQEEVYLGTGLESSSPPALVVTSSPAKEAEKSDESPQQEDRGRGKRKRLSSKRFFPTLPESDIEEEGSSAKKLKLLLPLPLPEEGEDRSGLLVCPTCCSRTPRSQFGKHLISHYHLHHSRVPRSHPAFRELVFRHLGDIVRLSPFRCDACAFYCNWDHEFVRHWREEHEDKEEEDGENRLFCR